MSTEEYTIKLRQHIADFICDLFQLEKIKIYYTGNYYEIPIKTRKVCTTSGSYLTDGYIYPAKYQTYREDMISGFEIMPTFTDNKIEIKILGSVVDFDFQKVNLLKNKLLELNGVTDG